MLNQSSASVTDFSGVTRACIGLVMCWMSISSREDWLLFPL